MDDALRDDQWDRIKDFLPVVKAMLVHCGG